MPDKHQAEFVHERTDLELIMMVTTGHDLFTEEILEAAAAELETRKLPPERLAVLRKEIKRNQRTSKLPLGIFWKLVAFLIPFITIIFVSILRSNGYHRKARDLKTWTYYGFIVYATIMVIAELLTL